MRRLFLALSLIVLSASAVADAPVTRSIDINQTVVQMELEEGISVDEAIDSMKLRANRHNMMFVAHQPLSQQLEKMGFASRRLEILQFCDPLIARKMVDFNPVFAAYMPCRIAIVETADGKAHLMMVNLDMLIAGAALSPELRKLARDVNEKLLDIMKAGAAGEL